MSLAVFIPASGWLGDRFGGKRVLLVAIFVFTLGSVFCGLAQDMTQLVVARVFQGAGGGMMAPVGMAMLYRVFPPAERVRAASILTIPTTVAPALGPVLGGFLVTTLTWRWVFFVNLPLGIAAIVFGALFLERMGTSDAGRFDVPGFVLGGAGSRFAHVRRLRRPDQVVVVARGDLQLHRRRRPARRLRLRGVAHHQTHGRPQTALGPPLPLDQPA